MSTAITTVAFDDPNAVTTAVSAANPLPVATSGGVAPGQPTGNPTTIGGQVQTTPLTMGANGQSEPAQMDLFGGLYVVLKAPGLAVFPYLATNADGVAAVSSTSRVAAINFPMVFNGTTFDRARGDTTGAWVKTAPQLGTDRSITATTTSQQLMAANTLRVKFVIFNGSAVAVNINLGATATNTPGGGNITIAATTGYYELSGYSGVVNIIAASTTGAITAREF